MESILVNSGNMNTYCNLNKLIKISLVNSDNTNTFRLIKYLYVNIVILINNINKKQIKILIGMNKYVSPSFDNY